MKTQALSSVDKKEPYYDTVKMSFIPSAEAPVFFNLYSLLSSILPAMLSSDASPAIFATYVLILFTDHLITYLNDNQNVRSNAKTGSMYI